MRIAVLCNDRLGFPAIHQLLPHRLIVAAGTSDRIPETRMILQQLCAQGGIPLQIFTQKNIESQLMAWLEQHKPDVVLVKTFPYKIPAAALLVPKYGFINFHYAPLPEYRGSNPLFWMIRNGIREGGLTVHRMDESFDTGEILLQEKLLIQPDASFGMVIGQLAFSGAAMTARLLQGLHNNSLKPQAQDSSKANWYGRPKAEDLTIRWNTMNASEIRALVNACNPWNKGAIVRFRGWTFAITDASFSDCTVPQGTAAGTILALDEHHGFVISCKDEKAIRADVVYTEEGYFAGHRLNHFGIPAGQKLDS